MNPIYYKALMANLRHFDHHQRVAIKKRACYKTSSLHRYHQGRCGLVIGTRGRSYVVKIAGTKTGYKTLIVNPGQLIPLR